MTPINIDVTTRGDVSDHAREQAREKLGDLDRLVKGPILGVRVVLIQEANPRISMPARAEAEVDLQGRFVRARTAAPSMEAAVDDVAERLQRHLRRYVERLITREREPAQALPGEWSHRSWSPPRPPTFVRPAEEREIVRRKSFVFGAMSVDEAADALEDLDHDFLLFHDAGTDADAVMYWRDDGLLAVIEPPSVQLPDETGPFVPAEPILFTNRAGGGGGGDERGRPSLPVLRERCDRPRQRRLPALRRPLRLDRACVRRARMPAVSARSAGKPRTSMRASPLPTRCLLLMAEPMRAETLAPSSTATRSDEMTPQLLTPMRELDRRQADGVDVRLLWCEADGSVLVAVKDHQTGEAFSVEVQEADRALEVFKHPYVYAAWQRTT